jgi:hypothetical protein
LLVTEQRPSGLVVARDGMDETSVSRALKRLDGRLCLQKHSRPGAPGGYVYKVVCVVSDTYAPVVLTWQDDYGRPLPLSSALIDEMHRHLAGARNKAPDADAYNEQLVASRRRDAEATRDAVVADHRAYVERGRTSVALGAGKPRYWRRERARPRSARGGRG